MLVTIFMCLVACIILFIISKSMSKSVLKLEKEASELSDEYPQADQKKRKLIEARDLRTSTNIMIICLKAMVCLTGVTIGWACVTTVPAGHVKVSTLFGKVNNKEYNEGIHLVNPLYKFHLFDARQKTHKETANVPSQDQLTTSLDVSIQYRVIASEADNLLSNTGSLESAIDVHLIPKLRSILREQGKTVKRAEDFFLESTQTALQDQMLSGLQEYLQPRGITVSNVLIREVRLPSFIIAAIQDKKEREQAAERQKAELERFATEQEQKVKTAEAERDAAKLQSERITVLADAEAYKIKQINEQLAKSPQYVKLKTVEQWNGELPKYSGGDNIPMIDLRK